MNLTIFREADYRFFFFSKEEPRIHVHIVSEDSEARFWLEIEIELANNYHYLRKQLGGYPRIVVVARGSYFETDFLNI
jgi:hypothetical protein